MADDVDRESPVEAAEAVPEEIATQAAAQEEAGSGARLARAVGAVTVALIAGLVGWLGYCTWQARESEQQRELFLQVARQSALDLTTIRHTDVDADVQRILDSSIGSFHDDFSERRQPFVDRIKRDQSNSEGTVTEAGLQSVTGNSARALVAVSVKLSTAGAAAKQLDGFRLRIEVQRVGDGAKVSDVEYVR